MNFAKYRDALLEDIKGLVSIPSVEELGTPQYKYGPNKAAALKYVCAIAKRMGFITYMAPDFAYGYIDYAPYNEQQPIFGIYCHLDVVPAGNLTDWDTNPWEAVIKNERIYGRGVLDSKTPTLVNLYVMYALKEQGFQPQRNLRLVLGLTEETTWLSIADYKAKEIIPQQGYTPDAKFPVVHAEKHILQFLWTGIGDNRIAINSEKALNMVCSRLEYVFEGATHVVTGVSAHGAHPEKGVSAILKLVNELKEKDFALTSAQVIHQLQDEDYFASLLTTGLTESVPLADKRIVVNWGYWNVDTNQSTIGIGLRIPSSYDLDGVLKNLKSLSAQLGLELHIIKCSQGMCIDPQDSYIQQLLSAYQQVTGDYTKVPLTMGGGSYARAFPHSVAFGPVFEPEIGTAHAPNEFIPLWWIQKSFEIYKKLIKNLK